MVSSGIEHYLEYGKYESRRYKKPGVNVVDYSSVLLRIETTNACNYHCSFCPHNKMDRQIMMMEDGLYKNIIKQGAELGMHNLDLRNFGEPLLDKDLEVKCNFAKSYGFDNIYIHTNGSLLTKERYLDLVEAGMTTFIISLSPEKEFNRTRGEEYQRVINNLVDISSQKKENSVVIDYINTGQSTEAEIFNFKKQLGEIGFEVREEIHLHNWAHGNTVENKELKLCERLWNSFTVLVNGKVALCCLDYNGENIVGDVNKDTIKQIINSPAYKSFRRSHIKHTLIGLCKSCDMPYVKD